MDLQQQAGFPDFAEKVRNNGFVRTFMPDEHRLFFENIPMIAAAIIDDKGRPWAQCCSLRIALN